MVKLPLAKKWKKVKIRITKSWKRFPKEDRQVKILEEVWRKAADLILGVQAIATSPQAAWPEADPQPVDDQVLGVVTAESHRAQAQDLVLVGQGVLGQEVQDEALPSQETEVSSSSVEDIQKQQVGRR